VVVLNPRGLLIYLFACNYKDLYGCASFNENEMALLKEDINDAANVNDYNDHCVMAVLGV